MPSWTRFTPVLLLLPGLALASSIQVNATCVAGCAPFFGPLIPSGPAGAVQQGQPVNPTTGSYTYTFGNGDPYLISWTYSASYSANVTHLSVSPTATYLGASPTSVDDLLTIQYFQNFYDASRSSWDGTFSESIPLLLTPNAGPGSTVTGELFYDGQGVGLIGPEGVGVYSGQTSATLSGLTGPTLAAIFAFNFDFRAGTTTDAIAAGALQPTPEPAQTVPLGIAFLGAAYWLATRHRGNYAK